MSINIYTYIIHILIYIHIYEYLWCTRHCTRGFMYRILSYGILTTIVETKHSYYPHFTDKEAE